jgi:hypothetical protein
MRRTSTALLAALALAACRRQEPAPTPAAGAPAPGAAAPSAGLTEVKGKVVERLDAPPYSYLRVATAQGETWTAVPKTDVAVGTEVTVAGAIPMKDFESKTLNRKFDLVYFGSLGGGPGAPHGGIGGVPQMPPAMGQVAPGVPQMPPPGMGGGMSDLAAQHAAASAAATDVGDVKVEKATGADGRTIAEVYAQRAALKEKSVAVRGKVVKFNEGIMGRNWLHLRDGTGAANKDNDLTVTTGEKVQVGDVVVVKGTVRVDKDFGTGHPYAVIVEDAKVSK